MRTTCILALVVAVILSCAKESNLSTIRLGVVKKYHEASMEETVSKWSFTSDTVLQWFDSREGKPQILSPEAAPGMWDEWDIAMNSYSFYDTLWFDEATQAVLGRFYENNDFYKLIGRPPNKTIRTYWFDGQDRIKEILIYWIPEENKTSDEFLLPIVEWAQNYYPAEINALYANQEIKPSTQNAIRWKTLLEKFHHFHDSLKSRL